MFYWHKLADERIEKSMREGEFENLEGAGRPLRLEDDSMVPEDLRMAYKILRNSGHVPPQIADEKEIRTVVEMLEQCEDEQTRYRQMQKLNYLITRWNIRYGKPIRFEKEQVYYDKIVERVELVERKKK